MPARGLNPQAAVGAEAAGGHAGEGRAVWSGSRPVGPTPTACCAAQGPARPTLRSAAHAYLQRGARRCTWRRLEGTPRWRPSCCRRVLAGVAPGCCRPAARQAGAIVSYRAGLPHGCSLALHCPACMTLCHPGAGAATNLLAAGHSLQKGAWAEAYDSRDDTPLHLAARSAHARPACRAACLSQHVSAQSGRSA